MGMSGTKRYVFLCERLTIIELEWSYMNIFKENIDFLKDIPLDSVLKADEEFFSVMKSIRERLGDKKYWLDNYVEKVLEAINNRQASECSEDGFSANCAMRHLCTTILNGEEAEHPLYSEIKASLEKYQKGFQKNETVRSLAIITAFPEYMKISVNEYLQAAAEDLGNVIDSIKLKEYFDSISAIVGEREMERFNLAIKCRFMIAPALSIYLQGMMNDYLYCFLHRDRETSRLVFQLLLDKNSDPQGVI